MRVRTFILPRRREGEKTQGERYKKTTREREREREKKEAKKKIYEKNTTLVLTFLLTPKMTLMRRGEGSSNTRRTTYADTFEFDVVVVVVILVVIPASIFCMQSKRRNKTNVRVRVFGVVFVSRDIRRRGETERDGTRERDWVERKSVSGKDDEHVEEGKTF